MKKDAKWSAAGGGPRTPGRVTEKPAGQESGAEFKDDPKAAPASGRRGGESRAEPDGAAPRKGTSWNVA